MILFTLACDAGHRFESWFRGNDVFDEQVAARLVQCPICQSTCVAKTIMSPAVVGPRHERRPQAILTEPGQPDGALLDESRMKVRTTLRTLREKILAEGHDVGERFPEEARRMHGGETPVRQIHGKATPEEARGLLDEGIMILPIPVLPDELN